jgi:MFS family permease
MQVQRLTSPVDDLAGQPGAEASGAGGSRSALIRICSAAFVASWSYAICRTPLLPMFARELGATPPLIGLLMGASTLTGVLLKFPAGALSDLLGRRTLLLAAASVFALMPFGYLAVSTLPLLFALRFMHGSAPAIFSPVAAAALSDIAPARGHGSWLSTYSTAQGAGQVVGSVLAGYLITGGRFHLAFLTSGAIGLIVPVITAGWRTPRRTADHAASWRDLPHAVADVVRDRLVLITSAAQAAQFVLNGALGAFLPLFGRDVLQLTTAQVGWLFGLQTFTTLAVRPAMGFASDRSGRPRLIVAGLTACGLGVAGLSLSGSAIAASAAIVVYAAGAATTTGATSAFITDLTRRQRYGAAHGAFGAIYDVGDAAGPIAAGLLVAAAGYAQMFRIMAAIPLMAAIIFAIATGAFRL